MLKVGMRVRIVKSVREPSAPSWAYATPQQVVGREATIIAPAQAPYDWLIHIDGYIDVAHAKSYELEPILPQDPKADEFIEKLKKLGNEPVPLTHKQLDEVRGA